MSRTLAEMLSAVSTDVGRDEILQLGREIRDAGSAAGPDREELLNHLTERIRWHFRAARYAIPSHEELQRMIDEHFG